MDEKDRLCEIYEKRTKQINKIYREIADKTPNLGCWFIEDDKYIQMIIDKKDEYVYVAEPKTISGGYRIHKEPIRVIGEIVGHSVMIGDVFDWIDNQKNIQGKVKHKNKIMNNLWKKTRKLIDDQNDECIDFIYNLINKNNIELNK